MEPAAPALADDQSILDTIVGFLKTAIDVSRVAVAFHQLDSSSESITSGHDLVRYADALSSSIKQMAKLVQADANSAKNTSHLLRACFKVGQDVSVHLERAGPSWLENDASQVDAAKFCVLWPRENVVTLGSRLSKLIQPWNNLQSRYGTTRNADFSLEDILPLSLLSLRNQTPSKDIGSSATIADGSMGGDCSKPLLKDSPNDVLAKTRVTNSIQGAGSRLASAGLINDFILETLAYKSMLDREDEVTEAHGQTLEWIFDKTVLGDKHQNDFSDQFTSWLRTPNLGSIYWITGKPGSGKSTLMRFLSQHPISRDYLQHWAGDRPVCTAGFFFWTSGSQEQRSQTGLLRYLLHQLLSANPELMPSTFPELWDKLRHMTTKERISLSLEWTVSDLMAAFHALLDAALPRMNICLFIDGLDEFDGDHNSIVDFFKTISAGENGQAIKMCLSSRPWAVFEGAFQTSVPSARLQDLTYEDMHRYAKDQLRRNTAIRRLFRNGADSGLVLVEDIVQRADGVFLWVRLAVERMLSRIRNGDDMNDMQNMLQSFPGELDGLFNKLVFEDQDQAQILDAAAIFRLMCARELVTDFIKDEASASLTVWELAFSFNENDDVPALEREVEEATDEEIVARCEKTAVHVLSRFSGLLTLHRQRRLGNLRARFTNGHDRVDDARSLADHKVKYIHRTVRDWLMSPTGAHDRLQSTTDASFDPHLRLLRSYVLRLKHPLEEVEYHRRLDEWYPDIALAMSHARYIAHDPKRLQGPLLDAMNNTLSWYWLTKSSDPFDHWARNSFGSYEVRMKAPPIRRPFLFLAVKFGLTKYVCGKLESKHMSMQSQPEDEELEDAEDNRQPTPLLSYATEFLCSRNKTIFPLSDPRLVEHLLAHPSDANPGPNDQYTDFDTLKPTTPWLALLRHLRTARRRGWIEHYDIDPQGTERWARIVRLFIEIGGADVDAVVLKDAWDPEITAVGVFELLEETYGAVEVRDIMTLLKERQHRS